MNRNFRKAVIAVAIASALPAAAVDKDLSNLGLLETDKDLDPIRGKERFKVILEKAKANAKDGK